MLVPVSACLMDAVMADWNAKRAVRAAKTLLIVAPLLKGNYLFNIK